VLDVDVHHGGEASLETLEATYDRLPHTFTAYSGGGGRHLYFQHPGARIPQCAQLGGFSGLDVRADGGYIVAPPSLHQSRHRYAWEEPLHPLEALPRWLCNLLTASGHPLHGVPLINRVAPSGETTAFWLRLALERARPGTGNATGYWLACRLRDTGISQEAAAAILLRYATQVAAGDHPYYVREALASLRSAYQHPVLALPSKTCGA
jgi:hypothetical protein